MLKGILVGNIGREPEMKYSAAGDPILRFTVASNGRKRVNNEWVDETTWVRVTVLGKRAETLQNMLTKGTRVYVDGRMTAQPWTGQDGSLNAGLELLANDVEFASNRQDGEGGQPARPAQASRPAPTDDSDLPF